MMTTTTTTTTKTTTTSSNTKVPSAQKLGVFGSTGAFVLFTLLALAAATGCTAERVEVSSDVEDVVVTGSSDQAAAEATKAPAAARGSDDVPAPLLDNGPPSPPSSDDSTDMPLPVRDAVQRLPSVIDPQHPCPNTNILQGAVQ